MWSVLLRLILQPCESTFPSDFTNEVCFNTRSFLCYKYLHNWNAEKRYDLQTCFLYLFSFLKIYLLLFSDSCPFVFPIAQPYPDPPLLQPIPPIVRACVLLMRASLKSTPALERAIRIFLHQ
ncbi:hypothetical protein HJG60_010683 [Phyllostomus discolor]|uniref:Uncharacterized protein n=1 Tax=Phyllostomus discolor TaxID=89673 RepID=A0A834APV1_9CHIR|nr:hypothetical protein HJG60_010683 [Phyllostomus discolor]